MINMHPCHQLGVYQSSYAITLSHIGLVFRLSLIIKTKLKTFTCHEHTKQKKAQSLICDMPIEFASCM
jgi:hypothetical protein